MADPKVLQVKRRFVPNDGDLITCLQALTNGEEVDHIINEEVDHIINADVYEVDPWDLKRVHGFDHGSDDDVGFFYIPRHPVSTHGTTWSSKVKRCTKSGTWHGNNKDDIEKIEVGSIVGYMSSFTFRSHAGRPRGERSYIMHEYRLANNGTDIFDKWAISKIHMKKVVTKCGREDEEQRGCNASPIVLGSTTAPEVEQEVAMGHDQWMELLFKPQEENPESALIEQALAAADLGPWMEMLLAPQEENPEPAADLDQWMQMFSRLINNDE